jgi:hypothetical protein
MMPTSETAREAEPLHIAKKYVSCYKDQNYDELTAILHPRSFRFSHHNRGVYAESAAEFVDLLRRMGAEVFPDRRFTAIRSAHVFDDVVLLDTRWSGRPIVTVPGRFEAGTELVMYIKSLIVVDDGVISEIRDHN